MTPPQVNQGRPASDTQISRAEQIHLQVCRAESIFPQDTAWRERLRVGTRTGGSLRLTQAAPIRLGRSHQSRPLAASTALHRRLAICSQRSPSPRARQGGHDPAVSSLLCFRGPHDLQVQHDRTGKNLLRSRHGFAQAAPLLRGIQGAGPFGQRNGRTVPQPGGVRIAKWAAKLSGYHITFEPRIAIKS
jgi:hypothetical protein